jgi:hypothetical protein
VALDGKVTSTGEKEGGRLGASMIPYRGRQLSVVAGLAWLRGTRGRCLVVGISALEVEEHGERQSGAGERSAAIAGRGGQVRLCLGAEKMRAG